LFHRNSPVFDNQNTVNEGESLDEGQWKCIARELRHFRVHVDSVVRRSDDAVAVRGWVETYEGARIAIAFFQDFTDRCRIAETRIYTNGDSDSSILHNAISSCTN